MTSKKLLHTISLKQSSAVESDFSNATDVADYLVAKGVPFREAYQIVGRVVKQCLEKRILLRNLPLHEWQSFHMGIEEDLFEKLAPQQVVAARTSEGGTGFDRVKEQLNRWRLRLSS